MGNIVSPAKIWHNLTPSNPEDERSVASPLEVGARVEARMTNFTFDRPTSPSSLPSHTVFGFQGFRL